MDNVDNFVYNFIFPRFKCILSVDNFLDNFFSLFITFFAPLYFVHVVYPTFFILKNQKNSYHPKTIAVLIIHELENSSYTNRASVIYIRKLDTTRRCTCMNNCATTNINSNMTTVTYNISRLCIGKTYLISDTS